METFLKQSFPERLVYNEAAQLCLRLYCSIDKVAEEFHKICNKNDLEKIFTNLSKDGFIKTKALEVTFYGATFHDVSDTGLRLLSQSLKRKIQ